MIMLFLTRKNEDQKITQRFREIRKRKIQVQYSYCIICQAYAQKIKRDFDSP